MRPRESEGARVLSVDRGPSSVRAELYDGSGTRKESTETKLGYEPEYTPDGGVTKDADEVLDLVARAIDGALSNARNVRISGVAMSTFCHSVVGLDREDRPTTPVITWADRHAAGAARGEKKVVATGEGLLHSPAWTRIMADALGKTVTTSGVQEASGRGAALPALEKLGELEIEEAEAPLGKAFEPDPERHATYREALRRQRRLYEAVLGAL